MLKRLLVSFLMFTSVVPACIHEYKRNFVIEINQELIEWDDYIDGLGSSIIVNDKELRCACGSDPIVVIIAYGQLRVYCLDCCPRVRYNNQFDLQEIII